MRQAWIGTHLRTCHRFVAIWHCLFSFFFFQLVKQLVFLLPGISLFTFSQRASKYCMLHCVMKKNPQNFSKEKSNITKSNGNTHLHKHKFLAACRFWDQWSLVRRRVYFKTYIWCLYVLCRIDSTLSPHHAETDHWKPAIMYQIRWLCLLPLSQKQYQITVLLIKKKVVWFG